MDRGVVTLKYNGRIFEARTQDVRLPATFFAQTLAGSIFVSDAHQNNTRNMEPRGNAWECIRRAVEQMANPSCKFLGIVKHGDSWITSSNDRKLASVWEAIKFFGETTSA